MRITVKLSRPQGTLELPDGSVLKGGEEREVENDSFIANKIASGVLMEVRLFKSTMGAKNTTKVVKPATTSNKKAPSKLGTKKNK